MRKKKHRLKELNQYVRLKYKLEYQMEYLNYIQCRFAKYFTKMQRNEFYDVVSAESNKLWHRYRRVIKYWERNHYK